MKLIKNTNTHKFFLLGLLLLGVIVTGLYFYRKPPQQLVLVEMVAKEMPSNTDDMNVGIEVPTGADESIKQKNGNLNEKTVEGMTNRENKFLTTKQEKQIQLTKTQIDKLTCIEYSLILLNILNDTKDEKGKVEGVDKEIVKLNKQISNIVESEDDDNLKSIVNNNNIPPRSLEKIYHRLYENRKRDSILPNNCDEYEKVIIDILQQLPREFRDKLIMRTNQIVKHRLGMLHNLVTAKGINDPRNKRILNKERKQNREEIYNADTWNDYSNSRCPRGCAHVGDFTVGCVDPRYGPGNCIFAYECTDCIR